MSENRRRNNIADMTIREQIEEIKEDFCVNYCKKYEEKRQKAINIRANIDSPRARQAELSKVQNILLSHCHKCPLTRL